VAKIFLLETDRQLADNCRDFFKRAGHQLTYYSDLQQAVAAADNNQPDLIIIDLFLAGRSGVEFLYELRSYPDWQNLPVIITGQLPADELSVYEKAFQQLGVSNYISKTTSSLAQLLEASQRILQPAAV
jgi:two-component system, OmpR family, response regulator BaeR